MRRATEKSSLVIEPRTEQRGKSRQKFSSIFNRQVNKSAVR